MYVQNKNLNKHVDTLRHTRMNRHTDTQCLARVCKYHAEYSMIFIRILRDITQNSVWYSHTLCSQIAERKKGFGVWQKGFCRFCRPIDSPCWPFLALGWYCLIARDCLPGWFSDHRAARLSLVLYVCVRVCVEGGSLQRVSINSNPSLACV